MSIARPFFSFFPQFTADPLNDAAWGQGFTDWDLVRRLPANHRDAFTPALGMYDPTDPAYLPQLEETIRARSPHAGLVVYHYFFDGHQALPGFEQQLLVQRSRLPFFLCWANETWSKRWVGLPNDIIIEQRHSTNPEIIKGHARHLARLFELEGYQRHRGRPLLLIYNPQSSPTLARSLALYRQAFESLGHHPYIGACLSYPQPQAHMAPFDFGCEFEPRFFFNSRGQPGAARLAARLKVSFPQMFEWLGTQRDRVRKRSGNREFRYRDYITRLSDGRIEAALRNTVGSKPLMRSAFLSWNNLPRYGDRSTVVRHEGISGEDLAQAIGGLRSDDDLPLFVNSWNEWSEGAALEAGREDHVLRRDFLNALGLNP